MHRNNWPWLAEKLRRPLLRGSAGPEHAIQTGTLVRECF